MYFHPGPTKGFNISLVLHVTGDRVIISGQDFLVLDDNVEDMVMGVQWYNFGLKGSPTDHI